MTGDRPCSKNRRVGRRLSRSGAAATAVATACALAAASAGHASVAGRRVPIGGPAQAVLGSTYTLTGHTGTVGKRHLTGVVVLQGRWNGGVWQTLARRRTDARGHYRLVILLRRRGTLDLRLLMPGAEVATKTLHVR